TDGCGVGNAWADNANDIPAFSSRGPVNLAGGDGRVKPDLMAPGTHVEAGIPQSNYDGSSVCNQYFPAGQTLYGWSSGTSHSCPAIAGGAALVYQGFLNKGRPPPSPALVKAMLMSSAQYMTGAGANDTLPSNNQGMGRMNLGRAFDGVSRFTLDQSQVLGDTGATYKVTGSIGSAALPFRVTLAWTDVPGPTTGAPWVNDLDLEVVVNGKLYRGNVFSGAHSVTGGAADGRNNVESVFLPAGTSGDFIVTVRATNLAGNGVPGNADATDQDFALVVYNSVAGPVPLPTISASPSSFTFHATPGGPNPASQALTVGNSGGGSLTWSASDNASWLTLSATGGTAPSSTTLSVNTSGLAAGTYTGAITISAAGATNSPVSVPVTLAVSTVAPELVANGGFELMSPAWVFSGNASWSSGAYPHGGARLSVLGNADNASGAEYQQIAVPGTSPAKLTFWLNVTSAEVTTTTQYDKLFVEVRNTAGTLLATLATYSNLDKGTAGVYVQRSVSLAGFRGQTIRLQLRATTDGTLSTTFRVDDVSLR
ncbi:MAG TPA: S8 family serine peptidase, partial [Myxococcales bacterium]|nr:S8 family serine peptidase [Myxococcales bacterium]